jgi:hypothetical protein
MSKVRRGVAGVPMAESCPTCCGSCSSSNASPGDEALVAQSTAAETAAEEGREGEGVDGEKAKSGREPRMRS